MLSRWFLGVSFAAFSLFVSAGAAAQIALDRLSPGAPGSLLVSGSDAEVSKEARLGFAAKTVYSHAPLVLRSTDASGATTATVLVSDQVAIHAQAAAVLWRRLGLDIDVPAILTNGIAPPPGLQLSENPSGWALGDVRLGTTFEVGAQSLLLPSLALRAQVWLPTGAAQHLTGSDETRFGLRVLLAKEIGPWAMRFAVGRDYQTDVDAVGGILSSDVNLVAGARYLLGDWSLGPELFGATFRSAQRDWLSTKTTNLEVLMATTYATRRLSITLAFGPGLMHAPGTPKWRAVLGLEVPLLEAATSAPARLVPRERWHAQGLGLDTETSSTSNDNPHTPGDMPTATQSETSGQDAATLPPCPTQGSDTKPKECAPDADNDGVVDALDGCPSEPGDGSQSGSLAGCPMTARVQGSQIVLAQSLNFENGKDTLTADSLPSLEQVANILRDHPEIVRVAIEGHTDNVGAEHRNLALSRRRAVAVMRWLIEHGVDERRLESRGFGPRRPISELDSPAGRAQNRRVEFLILKQDPRGTAMWKDGATND